MRRVVDGQKEEMPVMLASRNATPRVLLRVLLADQKKSVQSGHPFARHNQSASGWAQSWARHLFYCRAFSSVISPSSQNYFTLFSTFSLLLFPSSPPFFHDSLAPAILYASHKTWDCSSVITPYIRYLSVTSTDKIGLNGPKSGSSSKPMSFVINLSDRSISAGVSGRKTLSGGFCLLQRNFCLVCSEDVSRGRNDRLSTW